MIRVLWDVPTGAGWLGGLNYYKNLLHAVMQVPDRKIEPVILGASPDLPEPLASCANIPLPKRPAAHSPLGLYQRVLHKVWQTHPHASTIRKHNIAVFSHGFLGIDRKDCFQLPWIPDFQDVHLPQYFSRAELFWRKRQNSIYANHADTVIVSSEDAKKDFCRLFPHAAGKVKVLRFVAPPPAQVSGLVARQVLAKYDIAEPFIHLPNQFWAHKNHALAIESLHALHQRGKAPLVVATGSTRDYRNPGHYANIVAMIGKYHLEDRFRILGIVSFEELSALMYESVALLNPSFFEGWSSTVEEAKSMGKKILLSSIPVHHEQNPARGMYFSPHDSEDLAKLMLRAVEEYSPVMEKDAREEAAGKLALRMEEYGRAYEDIILEVLASAKTA